MTTHQSLHRAIAVLRLFTEQEPSLTVSEISRRLQLHKSTVSRILAALLEDGMVWHNAVTGRYSLGMAVVEMAGVALGQIDVRAAAIPHIERLATETSETVSVVVPRAREGMTVAYAPGRQPIRHIVWIGRRIPLRTTAAGKTILAARHAAGNEWRAMVEDAIGPSGIDSELPAQLAEIAARGYAEEVDEFEDGTSAIAAPVLDGAGGIVAAIALSGPTDRFDAQMRSATRHAVIEAARNVAADLGVQAAPSPIGARQ